LELAPPTNSGRNKKAARVAAPRFPSMNIQENVLLAPFTTFRIGGAARFFVRAQNVVDVELAMRFAHEKKLSVFVLGGGSNILISDLGFNGLVIKNEIRGIAEEAVGDSVRLIAGAGEDWDGFVKYAVEEKGLYGLENLSLIPGTVGATPVQNVGAYGTEAKDTIEWVEVYNSTTKMIEKLIGADCQFAYRDSIFKHERKGNVILRVAFLLKKNGKLSTDYKDVKKYFEERSAEPSLCGVRNAIVEIRTNKLPDVSKIGTAGSFFKNKTILKTEYQKLLEKYPLLPAFPVDETRVKIPTAWILDNVCGYKGLTRGNVGVYQNQALVLVNFGQGTAEEIKSLADEMASCVKEKMDISISPEVEYI